MVNYFVLKKKTEFTKSTQRQWLKRVYVALIFLIIFQTTPIPFGSPGAPDANAAGAFCFQGNCFTSFDTDRILRQHTVDYGRVKGKYRASERKEFWPKTRTLSSPPSWMTPDRRSLCLNGINCVSEPPPKVRLGSANGLIEWVRQYLADTFSTPITDVQRIVGDNPLYFSYEGAKTGVAIKIDVVGPQYRTFDFMWGSDAGLDCYGAYASASIEERDVDIDCFIPSFSPNTSIVAKPPCGWHKSDTDSTWKEAYPPRTNGSTTSFLLILFEAQRLYKSSNAEMQMSTGKECNVRVTTSDGIPYDYLFSVNTQISPPRPIIEKFEINPSVVKEGQFATLTWQTQGADDIELYEINDKGEKTHLYKPVLERRSMDVSPPTILSKFQLIASNSSGVAQSDIVELAVQLLGNVWEIFVDGFEWGTGSLTDQSFLGQCTIPGTSIDPCGLVTPVNIVKLFFMAFGIPPDATGILLTAMLVTNGLIGGLLSAALCLVIGTCAVKSENPLLTWDFLGSVLINVFNSGISGLASCAPPPIGMILGSLVSDIPTKVGGFLSSFGKFKKDENINILGIEMKAPFDLDLFNLIPFGIGRMMRDAGNSISNYTENNSGYRAGAVFAKSLDPLISGMIAQTCLTAKDDNDEDTTVVAETEKTKLCKDINPKGCELKVGEPRLSDISANPNEAKQLVSASVTTLETLGEVEGLENLPDETPSSPGKSVVRVDSGHYITTEITNKSQLPIDMKKIKSDALKYNLSDGLSKEDAFKKALSDMLESKNYKSKEISDILAKSAFVNKMVQCLFSNICGKK